MRRRGLGSLAMGYKKLALLILSVFLVCLTGVAAIAPISWAGDKGHPMATYGLHRHEMEERNGLKTDASVDNIRRIFSASGQAMDGESFAYIVGKPGYDDLDNIVKGQDGNFIAIGYTNDEFPLMLKFNPEGQIIWQKAYRFDPQGNWSWLCSIRLVLSGDSAIVFGGYDSTSDYYQDAFVGKINIDAGNMEDYRFYDTDYNHNWFSDGVITADGGFIAIGKGCDDQDSFHIVKLDSNLDKVWEKSFSFGPNFYNVAVPIISDEGYYYVVGYTISSIGDADIVIMKLDPSGNEVWHKVIGGPGNDGGKLEEGYYGWISKLIKTQDGNYAFLAGTESFGTDRGVLFIKFDSDGNITAPKLIDSPKRETIGDANNNLAQASDGTFVLGLRSGDDGVIMKISSDLSNIVWQKRYSAGEYTRFYGVLPDDSGIYAVGRAESSGDSNALIMKVNLNGDVSSPCIDVTDANFTISDVTIPEKPFSCNQGTVNTQEVTGRIVTTEDADLVRICPAILPDIKANGSDDPLFVTLSESVDISISLDPGDMAGEWADWWGILLSPYGTFPLFGFQCPLFELPDTSLFSRSWPMGWYIFLFGLDDVPDGAFELDWYDYVVVVSQPAGARLENIPNFDDIVKEKMKELIGE